MTTQSNMTPSSNAHGYVTWAKERLDEMDANLAVLESNAGKLQGDARARAESALAEMRAKRDAFQAILEKEGKTGQAAQAHTKTALEAGWSAFQASVHAASTQPASTPTNSTPPSGGAPTHS
jgi:hypothetical protein